jgi:hypothetical protein
MQENVTMRGRLAKTVVLVVSTLLLAGAVGLGVLGFEARSVASDFDRRAHVATRKRQGLVRQHAAADRDRMELERRSAVVPDNSVLSARQCSRQPRRRTASPTLSITGRSSTTRETTSARPRSIAARRRRHSQTWNVRDKTGNAEHRLWTLRLEAREDVAAVRVPITLAEELAAMAADAGDVARATQTSGADPNATADDYNKTIGRSNEIIDRYNERLRELEEQFDESSDGEDEIA